METTSIRIGTSNPGAIHPQRLSIAAAAVLGAFGPALPWAFVAGRPALGVDEGAGWLALIAFVAIAAAALSGLRSRPLAFGGLVGVSAPAVALATMSLCRLVTGGTAGHGLFLVLLIGAVIPLLAVFLDPDRWTGQRSTVHRR